MKLRDGFITYDTGDEQIMVAAGQAISSFRGMVRSNSTAAFMIDCLKKDISRKALIDRMEAKFDASRETIAADVDRILASLRRIGALDE